MLKSEGILEESRVGSSLVVIKSPLLTPFEFLQTLRILSCFFLLSESIASQQIRYALHPAIVCHENYSESESDLSVAGIAPY